MAGVYNINIPSSNDLGNPNSNNLVPIALPIAAGAPRGLADVTNASLETDGRKRQKIVDNASVTNAEVSQSEARLAAVTNEYAEGVYGVAGAPAWAVPLLALPPLLLAMDARLLAMDARQRNGTAQRRNLRNAGPGIDGIGQFQQLVKVNPGVGPPTPGQAVSGVVAANVGTVYPGALAPQTRLGVLGMTLAQISALAEWVNDQFGIVAADGIHPRREKLLLHYTYE